ncbi:MAG TPA: zinc-binding dehydrogenase [Ktedonobacteraceae bacterium]|nr:zinc-binding dehydrogenase [Ktedonobacteraceae bacterium]
MRAIIHQGQGIAGIQVAEISTREPGPDEVAIKLKAAALNHRDLWTCLGRHPDQPPLVLGADGAGIVAAVGAQVSDLALSSEVVINPSLYWNARSDIPPATFEILGSPTHGTLAEQVIVPRANIERKPTYLSWEEAAALPLSGLTSYRALFTLGQVQAGMTVVIPGIGGGTALQAFQFAQAAGARVIVTSSNAQKRERALVLGADLALESQSSWSAAVREATGGKGAHLVIESVGRATWSESLRCLARGGKLVVYGSTSGNIVDIDLPPFFLNWQSVLGTTMGSREEFREMLAFAERFQVRPIIAQSFSLDDGVAAFHFLEQQRQFGKVIVRLPD